LWDCFSRIIRSFSVCHEIRAAVDKVGRSEFETIVGIDDHDLAAILSVEDGYIGVAIVTIACQINKGHNDPDPAHSSVTECLKGTTIRVPPVGGRVRSPAVQQSIDRKRFQRLGSGTSPTGPLYEKKTLRLLSFSANTAAFLILGYFLGGIAISPLIGEPSCIGVSATPPGLVPCGGSIIGLVVSAIGGIGYTYYYFVKKL